MENDIIGIINGLMCSDTDQIHASTADLMNIYKNPESLPCLVHIVKTNTEKNIRHYAAVLLNQRLCKLSHWLAVLPEHKDTIMREMPKALITEEERCVRNALAQFVAILVKHEADKADTWIPELFNYIFERSSSADPNESERGSSTYATLAAVTPDQFSVHMETICSLFANILSAAEAQGDMSTPTVANIIIGTSHLLPIMAGNTATEQKITQVLPLVFRALEAIAVKGDCDRFVEMLDILFIVEYFPHLPNNVGLVLDFCLNTASNTELEDNVRVAVIAMLAYLVTISQKAIVEQSLLERILSVIFEILSSKYAFVDAEGDHPWNEETNCPLGAACQTLSLLSVHMPPERLIPTMLQLRVPARENPDPLCRGAILIGLALVVEGCSEAIRYKYLIEMIEELDRGIGDSAEEVQSYALLALSKFSFHLQPEISECAPLIVPFFVEVLRELVEVFQRIDEPDITCCGLLFRAMDTYWENLDEKIAPYLATVMECLFAFLVPRFSMPIWELAVRSVSSVSKAAKGHLVPYLPDIIEILRTCLVQDIPDEVASLRIQAIGTLGSIIRFVPKEHILPLANEAKIYCLMMIEEGPSDPDFRQGIFKLIGSLSIAMNESMAEVFPQVMTLIIQTVVFAEEVALHLRDQIEQDLIQNPSGADEDGDLESANEKALDTYYHQLSTHYLVEKEAAILMLGDSAANTGAAFIPYLQPAFENVFIMLSHGCHEIRTISSFALREFVIALNRSGDTVGVTCLCERLIPKLAEMMRWDKVKEVLSSLIYDVATLFWTIRQPAMLNQECVELINACIRDTFLHKMACQLKDRNGDDDEDNEKESDQDALLMERTCNLLTSFGCVLDPQTFSLYFGQLFSFVIQRLDKATKDDKPHHRAYIYRALGDAFRSLESYSARYFDTFCPLFLEGTKDTVSGSREKTFYALGELVIHSGEKSIESFPTILQTLSDAIATETAPAAKDNICGALARLILSNIQAVPLASVLPLLMSHLPLREDFKEYHVLLQAFHVLCTQAAPSTIDHIEGMLHVIFQALRQEQIADQGTKRDAMKFIKMVYTNYPDKFNNLSPETLQYIETDLINMLETFISLTRCSTPDRPESRL